MAEELVLTDPVVVPEKVTSTYRVVMMILNWSPPTTPVPPMPATNPAYIRIDLRSDLDEPFSHTYHGDEAIDLMKWMNTANFSTTSMHKRILQKLSNDGVLPGEVTGAPDP